MSTISSSTTNSTAYKVTADTTGALVLQTGATPTTAVTISTAQVVTLANALPVASGGTGTTSTTFANLTTNVTGTLPVANGGTGVTTSTGSGANVLGTSPSISGAVLTSMASSVITSGTAVASTSGTSIDFTSLPSWIKRITVMFAGVSTNGSSPIQIQIGTSGGIQTTSYTSGAWIANTSNGNSTTGLLITNGGGSTYLFDGMAYLTLLNSATGLFTFNSIFSGSVSGINSIGGGAKTLSGTLDRVRITTVNGTDTFDAGSINILYE